MQLKRTERAEHSTRDRQRVPIALEFGVLKIIGMETGRQTGDALTQYRVDGSTQGSIARLLESQYHPFSLRLYDTHVNSVLPETHRASGRFIILAAKSRYYPLANGM